MFRNIRKFMFIKALSLVIGSGTAHAAPGDIDPAFGERGIFYPNFEMPIVLPDDRFAI